MKFAGVVCDKCGVEVTRARVRRERMGHIELASPVSHVWFFKGLPSRIGQLLDMSLRELEKILYFEEYVVLDSKIPATKKKDLVAVDKARKLQEEHGPDALKVGMGAEAIRELLRDMDLDSLARDLRAQMLGETSVQKRKKIVKRLKVIEAFLKSGNQPDWMILEVVPVIPPELRPLVPLGGGRFATSDLNDLYRRVINRNNRLKRLLELGAPEIIIRNEKRMLQEAVDSLIDNGRRGRAVSGSSNHKLKSLSDMLKGKQGRFRQNLLGKRVDYSGRSVIVVGPELKLHQCGLPKRMALELFKPFVMHGLVARGLAHNIKSAKRIVERVREEVWDVLEDIIKQRPVLLNRAPTLHRLGIQAFEPVLIDGSAIQIHPLVCTAFNADFDGDQMAVHVPLSRAAVAEARQIMLSSQNLLYPSSGEPVVAPTLDIVLGCYYLTEEKRNSGRDSKPKNVTIFHSYDEAKMPYEMSYVDLWCLMEQSVDQESRKRTKKTVGRIIINEELPEELGFRYHLMDKEAIKELVSECSHKLDNLRTAEMVDRMKNIGFEYATKSGISIAMNDLRLPEEKEQLLAEADARIAEID